MAVTLTTPNTLSGVFVPESGAAGLAKQIAIILLGTGILAIAAQINVPIGPVKITLQSLAVALIAGWAGWRIGVATVALYIAEGLSGLPIFSAGGGIGYILSPSFGFIIGWLPMAYIIGRAADRGVTRRPILAFLTFVIGDAVSFIFGFLWFLYVSNVILRFGGTPPSWINPSDLLGTAWNGAIGPFIVWDLVKMAFAAITLYGAWGLVKKRA